MVIAAEHRCLYRKCLCYSGYHIGFIGSFEISKPIISIYIGSLNSTENLFGALVSLTRN